MTHIFVPGVRPPEGAEGPVLCFVFRKRELLVTGDHGLPAIHVLEEAGIESVRSQYLGQLGDQLCHSVELPADVDPPSGMRFHDLRALYGRLDEALHALAGRAVQVMEWDRTHQFCGACGKPTVPSKTDRSRSCPDCGVPQYPRLSPAMIVSVERGPEILLARSPHFPPGIYSTLAGFVEPGESAEEAVAREVLEESGIHVKNVRYFGSQPWPYPNSLMLGFTAEYASGEIVLEDDEIEDARWFHADDMPNFFPGRMSISQWLIHDFLDRKRSK